MKRLLVRRVQRSLNHVATCLEEFRDPAAARFRGWSRALQERFSESLVQEIWVAIQPMRAHMGYLDYADEAFNEAFDELFRNLEDLISELRRASKD
ncbi:MAG: hypothetical protein H5U03_01375 [Clostridia bacterium]|nr:hypothetical protein [Clostridia bacterium]